MPGVGTLIDMSGIIAGGATALAFGRLFSEQMKNMMMTVCGISVFVIGITGIMQGSLTLLACQAKAFLTDEALASLTTTGSIMILCLGINLIWNKEIRVANMLPMVVIGVALSYIPGL